MQRNSQGFTLIELSIVLVIIGLIAASVLVGKTLILSAQIRAQISQIEKLNTAVNTFRGKYGGLPGDLIADKANSFGFTTRSGAESHGDGNGTLEACADVDEFVSDLYFGCETALFWSDLGKAKLIPGTYDLATDDYVITMNSSNIDQYLPKASIGGYLAVFSNALMDVFALPTAARCENKFCFSLIKSMVTLLDGRLSMTVGITPYQAYAMDHKMDDAKPATGRVLSGPTDSAAGTGFSIYYIPGIGNSRCRDLAANSYNLLPDEADKPECLMNFFGQ